MSRIPYFVGLARFAMVTALAAVVLSAAPLRSPAAPVIPPHGSAPPAAAPADGAGSRHRAAAEGATTRNVGWRSSNWAGYVVQNGPFRSVSGRWTVPRVSPSSYGYSAMWIGIDGVGQRRLIQTGTEQDTHGGRTQYYAWWEILPAPAVRVSSLSVQPGDRVNATIQRIASGRWRITITDSRSGTFTTVQSYSGPGSSAEWIEETPLVNDVIVPLARHGPIVFDHTTVNGLNPRLGPANSGALLRRGVQLITPSAPDLDRDGFRLRQSSSTPSPPVS